MLAQAGVTEKAIYEISFVIIAPNDDAVVNRTAQARQDKGKEESLPWKWFRSGSVYGWLEQNYR
jgi:hypothetical protein